MPPLQGFLALCRVSNLPTVWMNVLTAGVLSVSAPLAGEYTGSFILLMVSLSCFYCGGMAFNDVCDLDYDRKYQAYRPIPAGRITLKQAWLTTLVLFACGVSGLLFTPDLRGFFAGLLLLAAICVYDRYHKRYSASVVVMAATRGLVYITSALALTGTVQSTVWLIAGIQALYILLLSVVARLESRTVSGRYAWPLIPWMITVMPVLDGCVLALLLSPTWLGIGLGLALATRFGQRYVRGD